MRKVSIVIGLCAIVALGLNLSARQAGKAAPGGGKAAAAAARDKVEDLKAIMTDVSAGNTALNAAIMMGNAADAATQAGKLSGYFTEASVIFAKEKVDDAAKMSKEISAAADDIAKGAKGGKVPDAATVKTKIARCGECHKVHRDGDAKTGYKLKK